MGNYLPSDSDSAFVVLFSLELVSWFQSSCTNAGINALYLLERCTLYCNMVPISIPREERTRKKDLALYSLSPLVSFYGSAKSYVYDDDINATIWFPVDNGNFTALNTRNQHMGFDKITRKNR